MMSCEIVFVTKHEMLKTNTLTSIAVWTSFTSFAHWSMVRMIALMFFKYAFHVALRIANKLDWILDADNLTLKILSSGSRSRHWREHTGANDTPRQPPPYGSAHSSTHSWRVPKYLRGY
jgi:hypothetical protein